MNILLPSHALQSLSWWWFFTYVLFYLNLPFFLLTSHMLLGRLPFL